MWPNLRNGKWDGLKQRQTLRKKKGHYKTNPSGRHAVNTQGSPYASIPTQGLLKMQRQLGREDAMMSST
jgi:hypothetical protein